MKRILSIILCVAMLMSMVAMAVSADPIDQFPNAAEVTSSNVMSFSTDKETYAPGDEIVITATMDSIWGDASIVGDINGYEGTELPGAYGMACLVSTLVFPLETFTPLAGKDLIDSSTVTNIEYASVTKTALSDAKKGGFYNFQIQTPGFPFNEDEDAYVFLNGSGDLFNYRLTVNEDAKPGTYRLPVGPYVITDLETGADDGFPPEFEFFGQWYSWIGNSDSLLYDRECDYGAGASSYEDGRTDYLDNIAYVEVTISAGDATEEDIAAAAAVDAMIDNISNTEVYPWIDAVNHDGVYTHFEPVTGSNFVITLDMKKGPGNDDTFGFIGGVTDLDGATPRLFYNPAVNKFQIAKTNSWNNASEVIEVFAESEEIVLNDWTKVEFIYAGDNLSIEVNDEVVCSYTHAGMPYQFYIFYPSKACVFVREMKAEGEGFDAWAADCTNGSTFNASVFGSHAAYGEGSFDELTLIETAEAGYAALTDLQKYLVTKYDALVAARTAYDQGKAAEVDAMIAAIGEVTYAPGTDRDSMPAIEAAEAAYAALTEAQQGYVTKLKDLEAARESWETIFDLDNRAKAGTVDSMIDAIGTVTFDSRQAIEDAEAAYAALTDLQKEYVTKLDVLEAARAEYNKYAPIMAVEKMIDGIGPIKYVGTVTHFDWVNAWDKGYYNFPDRDGDNCTWDLSFEFDFMYIEATTDNKYGSMLGGFRNGESFAGYDFKLGAFTVANGGGWTYGSEGSTRIYGSAEYELLPEVWYTMKIEYIGSTARVSLNGELMVEAEVENSSYDFYLFYPQQVEMYIGANNLIFGETYPYPFTSEPFTGRAGDLGTYTPNVSFDVKAPVDYEAKIVAAEEAVAALTEEQFALLSQDYKDALAKARADYDALYAEIVAAAEAVEAQFEAIAVFEDIAAAEAAYNALTDTGKSLVENYATFEAKGAAIVSAMIDAMETEEDIAAANAAYNSLTAGTKALVTNYNVLETARADVVEAKIDAIGDVTKDSNAAIAAAEAAYNGLTEAEKALVENVATMTAARAEYNAIIAAAAAVDSEIGALIYGGSAIKMVYNNNGYSQLDPNPDSGEFTFGFALNISAIQDAGDKSNHIGGATSSEQWAGYDLIGKRFVIEQKRGAFDDSTFTDDNILAEYPIDLALNTWYYVEFVYGADYITIKLDGKEILTANVDRSGGTWYIFYPRFVEFYMDAIHVDYWAGSEVTGDFSGRNSKYFFGSEGAYWAVNDAPAGLAGADAIASARANYDALSDKAKAAVTRLATLETAESVAPVAEIIAALNVPAADVNNYADVLAQKDAIVAAKAAYDALDDSVKGMVDTTKLDDALASFNKALILDAALNNKLVAPQNVQAVGGEGTITVTWDAVANGVKYWVSVDGFKVLSTTETSVVINASEGDHVVSVTVAVNDAPELGSAGVYVSGTSAEVACTVAPVVLPTVDVTTTATDDSITAEWNAIADNAVYYVTFKIGDTELIVKTQDTTITLAKYVTASTMYSVSVQALIPNGDGTYTVYESNVATGYTAMAVPFKINYISLNDNAFYVDWTACKGAARYYVVITNTQTNVATTIRIDDVTVTDYWQTSAKMASGVEYSVVVKALAAGAFVDTAAVTVSK